ncbi:MAG: sigma-54 dependent transcriptional regulator [Planctomycetota bacterium]|nr:sigma-54 dependent transcriptional regulator [Planctomycetota bacterium]MCX8040402.1 sigma-54 dependent transcriptional regulator [Planctomycetota bacterium]MDW8372222.1 sigma-54 dependent transcriptional regulator [Planctomycetota bacterium]
MPVRSAVVADDEILNRELLAEMLPRFGITVRTAKDGVQALKALEAEPADLLITDVRMPGMGGLKLLAKVREKWPDLPVVMMTAYASVESAVESMRQGAYDYLMKPFGVEQVEALLLRLNERQQLVRTVAALKSEVRDRHRGRCLLGASPAMQQLQQVIERAARSSATVLISGESGTGKELVARALHELSPRAAGPFVKVNCAALTETLLTSELFGHEKGAFTGAIEQRLGRFELADGGTLLLDEVSEISPELQAKLLRVLEEREFERVGGSRPIRVDVRIIATTNRDLAAEVAAKRFREDLYYRLHVVPIHLPPLRERAADIPLLLEHYLEVFRQETGAQVRLAADAVAALAAYDWPGNVRELVNVVERLSVLGEGELDAAALRALLPELAGAAGRRRR